ncbi:hypothetical protein HDU88_003990 [Geranomyces variabilis]|nr:hypothetical protein HDU88_003990 [Geranomyces variabilis]
MARGRPAVLINPTGEPLGQPLSHPLVNPSIDLPELPLDDTRSPLLPMEWAAATTPVPFSEPRIVSSDQPMSKKREEQYYNQVLTDMPKFTGTNGAQKLHDLQKTLMELLNRFPTSNDDQIKVIKSRLDGAARHWADEQTNFGLRPWRDGNDLFLALYKKFCGKLECRAVKEKLERFRYQGDIVKHNQAFGQLVIALRGTNAGGIMDDTTVDIVRKWYIDSFNNVKGAVLHERLLNSMYDLASRPAYFL